MFPRFATRISHVTHRLTEKLQIAPAVSTQTVAYCYNVASLLMIIKFSSLAGSIALSMKIFQVNNEILENDEPSQVELSQ